MVAATFNVFEENFGDDHKRQSDVLAIANTLTGLTNTLIAEKGLGENTYIDAVASLLTAMSLDLGRKFEVIKQSLKPKEKFRDLVENLGKTLPKVNKLIRAAKVADNFPAQTAYMLGIDMLAQLAQSKYANLIDDFIEHPPVSQLEASLRMKEFSQSQPKKPKTPWKYVGAHKTSDGLAREYQAPHVSETVGLAIERECELSNLPPRIIVEQAIQAFVEPEHRVEELQIAAEESLLYKENFQQIELRAKEFEAEAKELRNIKAENMQMELEAQQVKEIACNLVDQIPSIFFFKSLITYIKPTPVEAIPLPNKRTMDARNKVKQVATQKTFKIGEIVSHGGALYTIASEPDEDGDILCRSASGQTRHLQPRFIKKCNVS
ncbi:MAG: hypothetical protein PUP92_21295 [Rhizonema sp. PD38]|nr:hypothetical protein [Rhizonema sp. PD38]